jgi:dTDP-4-dehydrorhamnose 3,5-epimerase
VPVGFAHGFCVTSNEADVTYKVSSYYDAATEAGIAWDDPALGVEWPVDDPLVSERDRANPTLKSVLYRLPSWEPNRDHAPATVDER